MESAKRQQMMIQEEKLFKTINSCCNAILKTIEGHKRIEFLAKKGQIVPNNYKEIIEYCESALSGKELELVRTMQKSIDAAVEFVVERYMQWALVKGEQIGKQLGVDAIESRSCAVYALYRAAFTYVPGNGFANYAPFWIKQLIQKSMDNRMLVTVDQSAGDEDSRESMKDKIAGDPQFEPLTVLENKQMSEIFQRLVRELPEHDRGEVTEWWYNDAKATPVCREIALQMHACSN